MNLHRKRRPHAAVEASSLSDILFFLLLFFLIISTLASPNAIRLLLPKASSGQTVSRQSIRVSITADKQYYIEKTPIDYNQLANELSREALKYDKPTVVLRVDKTLPVEELVKVVDLVNQQKMPLVIATDKVK